MLKNISEICCILSKRKNIAVITHKNADPDAFFSAHAILELIRALNKESIVDIYFPEGVSALTKKLVEYFSLDLELWKRKAVNKNYDLIIIVDTGSPEQLGEYSKILMKENVKILLIDHHYTHEFFRKRSSLYVDPNAKSTAELIYNLYRECSVEISKNIAKELLAAIIYDTRQFSIARPLTFEITANLVKLVGDFRDLIKAFRTTMEISEKIARLKAAMRMDLYRANSLLIAISNVGAYEASAARAMLDLGADVAFVISENNTVRVSARAKEEFYKKTGIHLGKDVMSKLGESIGGTGGGHDIAAGAEGRNVSIEFVKGKIIEILIDKLKKKGLKLTPLKP